MQHVASLFRLRGPVSRRTYWTAGVSLLLLKYLVEAALVYATTGRFWSPLDYVNPIYSMRAEVLADAPRGTMVALVLWSIPFVWIGVALTMRRAVTVGGSPWLCMLFFLPGVGYLLMLVLGLARDPEELEVRWRDVATPSESAAPGGDRAEPGRTWVAFSAMLPTALFGVGTVLLCAHVLGRYSNGLFFVAPFVLGALCGFLYNRQSPSSAFETMGVTVGALVMFAGLMMLFALEGIVCLLMALPLALPLALPGALIGRAIALAGSSRRPGASFPAVVLPIVCIADSAFPTVASREVVSCIEIDASPVEVWPHVVSFSELAPPSRLVFHMGIAYPVRARIEGEGVGAVRYCEFSTGPFVEPITAWEEPTRLAFDVAEQPPPMRELSIWSDVNAPHLDGYLMSRRGEFRLIALEGGTRTRLEGTTWYDIEIAPVSYWSLWSDFLIGSIHDRVLEKIREEAEGS